MKMAQLAQRCACVLALAMLSACSESSQDSGSGAPVNRPDEGGMAGAGSPLPSELPDDSFASPVGGSGGAGGTGGAAGSAGMSSLDSPPAPIGDTGGAGGMGSFAGAGGASGGLTDGDSAGESGGAGGGSAPV